MHARNELCSALLIVLQWDYLSNPVTQHISYDIFTYHTTYSGVLTTENHIQLPHTVLLSCITMGKGGENQGLIYENK